MFKVLILKETCKLEVMIRINFLSLDIFNGKNAHRRLSDEAAKECKIIVINIK